MSCGPVPLAVFWAMFEAIKELQESNQYLLNEVRELQERAGVTGDRIIAKHPERYKELILHYKNKCGQGFGEAKRMAREALLNEHREASKID